MKNFAKQVASTLAAVICLPLTLCYRLNRLCVEDKRRAFRPFSELCSILPGTSGQYLRRSFYRSSLSYCAKDCYIGFGTLLATSDTHIAENVYIGAQCSLGRVSIGKDSLLASGVRTISGLSQHGIDQLDRPIREQQGSYSSISIGENCWIGEAALIAADIGSHSIVAAGSVVIDKVPEYSIVAGNPAKIIRSRLPEDEGDSQLA